MMKKTIFLFVLILSVTAGFAQKGKVSSAQSYKDGGKLDKAVETIEMTIDPSNEKSEKTLDWPKTWEVRGEIFQAVYQSKDANIKKLSDNPLAEALKSYKKALDLDEKDRNDNSIKIKLTLLISDFTDQAVQAFHDNNYELALQSFKQILEIQDLPLMVDAENPQAVDTVIIFNAGLAAYNAEKYDEAIKYYEEAAKHDYNGARTYELISSSYILKQDTVNAVEALQEGFEKYPDNSSIMVQLINIYLNSNKVDEAMKYLELAIENDPNNASFHFARGSLYDKINELDKAVEAYKKAIEIKEDYADAYYNLGAIYYNKGVKQIEVANDVPTNQPEKFEEEKEKADIEFKKALEPMENAAKYAAAANEKDTQMSALETLKTVYYRLKMMDQFDTVNAKLEELQQ
ncbi:tetratricopeptide repeat protein [uncultured Sunxiuqinia sp.]|uniref:tetratricopeptide repeat protein n=1 Tax=Sunxiuqinia rutila TaxID=1397841 RepID=UPI00260D60A4|nr:tetratricopeptide repeat protein [uncultured Sunxiuqinia sp.]